MKIEFDKIERKSLPHFKGGNKCFDVKMFSDDGIKIMQGRLAPGATIGMHAHDTSSEIIYVLSGNGKVLYDGVEELLNPGDCHYCPKGHSHSLQNCSNDLLEFFAVVPEL